MEGIIKSFLPSKSHGFIEGTDGKSYFFHIQDMKQRVAAIEDGQFVHFDESVTPKGYRARNVEILDGQTYYLQLASRFFWGKNEAPQGLEVAYSEIFHTYDKDLDIAQSELKETAKRYGFNAVLDVTYSKDTESSGNYKYSVHHFMGECAVLAQRIFTKDRNLAKRKNQDFQHTINQIKANVQTKLDAEAKKRKWKRLLMACIAGAIVAFIANNILQAVLASPK